ARAIAWAIDRDAATGGRVLSVNVGAAGWNYQVKDLAEAVAAAVPGTRVSVNTAAPPDKRSYRVDFSLYSQLAPAHQPRSDLRQSVTRLKEGLDNMGFTDKDFRNSTLMRLRVLEGLIGAGRLSSDLRWTEVEHVAA
ncbi:MAG: NAD-dependent epimerase/dehydratase family protein, partial [Acetobacteraceae bacterium]